MNEQEIFVEALEQDANRRAAFLDEACGTDTELRRRIDNLLKCHDQAGAFIDKPAGEIIADFLLAIPRMTLAIGGTLAAWQRLSDPDLAQAANFLHRLAQATRLPMSGVHVEIPDPAAATRILFALQITQVIDAHRDGQEFWLKLNPLRPASLRLARGSYADA